MKVSKRKLAIAGSFLLWVGIIVYLAVSLTFVKGQRDGIVCRKVIVDITDSLSNRFVNKDDVIKMANKEVKQLVGTRINKINTDKIERRLRELDLLNKIDVYTSASGVLTIKVSQREAIMRVYNLDGKSWYIDEEGYIIPLSARYAANVIIVNGNIVVRKTDGNRARIFSDTSSKKGLLCDLYDFVTYVRNDKFWNSQIVQIYVNSSKDIDLITRVGSHTIKMGSLDNYKEKLKRLMAFYKNALPVEGWNKYKVINLKYENQVICKK